MQEEAAKLKDGPAIDDFLNISAEYNPRIFTL